MTLTWSGYIAIKSLMHFFNMPIVSIHLWNSHTMCRKPNCPSLILPPRSRRAIWQLMYTLNPQTNINTFHPVSCHPKHCFKSMPFSQAIRVKRICPTVETTKQRLGDLHHHLKRRGYNDKVIESGFSKASEIDRNDLLEYKEKKINKRVPLVLTCHPS